MGCEIGKIRGDFNSEAHVEAFIECFNTVMEEKEDWFEEDHRIGADDFNAAHSCELDIWGRFRDTMNTHLADVVAALIHRNPSEPFYITYYRDWDNCGESYFEEFHFDDSGLSIHFSEEDYGASDEDYDEDEDSEGDDYDEDEEYDEDECSSRLLWEKDYLFKCIDGRLTLVSGEADKELLTALGIE